MSAASSWLLADVTPDDRRTLARSDAFTVARSHEHSAWLEVRQNIAQRRQDRRIRAIVTRTILLTVILVASALVLGFVILPALGMGA